MKCSMLVMMRLYVCQHGESTTPFVYNSTASKAPEVVIHQLEPPGGWGRLTLPNGV
jgi:hypothetical protein